MGFLIGELEYFSLENRKMMNRSIFYQILVLLTASFTFGSDFSWNQIASLPDDQPAASAAVIDGKIYLAGGHVAPDVSPWSHNILRIYDPNANSWSDGSNMSERRRGAGSGTLVAPDGHKEFYVVGGYSGYNGLSSVERYIVSENRWETIAPRGCPGSGVMVAVVNNNLYAMGGHYNWYDYYSLNEVYDRENNTWLNKPYIRRNNEEVRMDSSAIAVVGNKIYLFGGMRRISSSEREYCRYTLIYDTVSESWSSGQDVPRPCGGAKAVSFDNKIYLFGGNYEQSDYDVIDVYDTVNDVWATADNYPGNNLANPTITQTDNTVYSIGSYWSSTGPLECWKGAMEPNQPSREEYTPPPTTGKKNLILFTHGAKTSEAAWNKPAVDGGMWQEMLRSLNNAKDDFPDRDDWEVRGFFWDTDLNFKTYFGHLIYCAEKAKKEGRRLAKEIIDNGYEHIHLIAHSAGSVLISTVAANVNVDSPGTTIHTTYLDPYEYLDFATTKYGLTATWSDHYRAWDATIGFTHETLPYSYNVDVTELDDYRSVVEDWRGERITSSHGWPVWFYIKTINNSDFAPGYGFARSLEAGGWDDSLLLQKGNDPIYLPDGDSIADLGISSTRKDANKNLENNIHSQSTTGLVTAQGENLVIETGSPAWGTFEIEIDKTINFIDFNMEFTSDPNSEGLLAVYWDNELLSTVDERFALVGSQKYSFAFPESAKIGSHSFSFRLDPYTAVPSKISVDSFATGYTSKCGDADHPYPSGDFNSDCIVNISDFVVFARNWLECNKPECD